MSDRRMALSKRIFAATVYLLLFSLIGCDASPTTFPVAGSVKHKKSGKTWSGGTITFQLQTDPTMNPTGSIQKDGSFSLTTHYANGNRSSTKPGAPAGLYSVTIEPDYGPELPTHITGHTVSEKFTVKEGENSFTVEVDK